MPTTRTYRPAPRQTALGGQFSDPVEAAPFPRLELRFRNQRWAERVGLDALSDDEWCAHFGRFEPLPDNLPEPLALRYHGHQFQSYNSALGDGRGFLFAQVLDDRDRLLDLATKGSGQTPWSRGGDGRLTLKGGVREVLATEMLEALGVSTSKSFSLFETGEALTRNDEPSPTRSSVLVRLGHSHIRFGTFQRHAHHQDRESLRALVEYSLTNYAPELCHLGPDGVRRLLQLIVRRSAALCASWMAAGFVHGVLNTDNMNVTGESFDYGPFRFLPTLDPGFTAAYFDHGGLYAYGNQPAAVRWNLERLAEALAVIDGDTTLAQAVNQFEAVFAGELDRAIVARLGVRSRGQLLDRLLRVAVMDFLDQSEVGFDRFFFDWTGGGLRGRLNRSPARELYRGGLGAELRSRFADYVPMTGAGGDYFDDDEPCTLLIDEVEAIWDAIDGRDDWSPFETKIAAIRRMGVAMNGPVARTEGD